MSAWGGVSAYRGMCLPKGGVSAWGCLPGGGSESHTPVKI